MVEGLGESQQIITDLGKKHRIFLKSKNDAIELDVKEVIVGQLNVTQAILKPKKALLIGETYEIKIENLSADANHYIGYKNTIKKFEKVTYIVDNSIDSILPQWIIKPLFKTSSYTELGCGPHEFVNFTCKVKEDSEYLVKVMLKDMTTLKTEFYYLVVNTDQIAIGHEMCSGAFFFKDSTKYMVVFDLMDASGNYTKWDLNIESTFINAPKKS